MIAIRFCECRCDCHENGCPNPFECNDCPMNCDESKCRVENIYTHPLTDDDTFVYIGRAGKGKDGYFGNPYLGSVYGRARSIELFRTYFYRRMIYDEEFVIRVKNLRGKTLVCFCKPQACHGDVIAEYVNANENERRSLREVGKG